MRQRLRGFAQPHVIGQDAGQALRAQVLQPGQASQLIGPQLQPQTRGCCHRPGRPGRQQPFAHGAQPGIANDLPAGAGVEQFQAAGIPIAQADRAFVPLRVGQQIDHRADDSLQRRGRGLDAPPARRVQHDDGVIVDLGQLGGVEPTPVALDQVGNHRREVQAFALDLDAQGQQP